MVKSFDDERSNSDSETFQRVETVLDPGKRTGVIRCKEWLLTNHKM